MIGVSVLAAVGWPAPADAASRYVFVTFKGDAEADEKLSVYTSTDGVKFTLLSNTGYGGPTGVLRDPSIIKHSDGKYYIAHTIYSWTTNSKSFAIASSTDLLRWTHLTMVDASVQDVQHTWAPEWFKDTDGSIHILVSIDGAASSSFRPLKFTAKSNDLTAWSGPESIGIGTNYIDTFVVKAGSTYHAFAKNETTKYIEHATASSLTGPWTWVGKGDWAGWGSGKEGPALYQLETGGWRLFMDCYSGCGYLYTTSSDLTAWSQYSTVSGLSGARHGTVLREDLPDDAGVRDAGAPDGSATDLRDGGPGSGRDGAAGRGSAGGGRDDGSGGTVGLGGAGGGFGRAGDSASTAGGGADGRAIGRGGAPIRGDGSASGQGGSAAAAGGSGDPADQGGSAGRSAIGAGGGGRSGGAHRGGDPAGDDASGVDTDTGVPSDTNDGCGCRIARRHGAMGPSPILLALGLISGLLSRRPRKR